MTENLFSGAFNREAFFLAVNARMGVANSRYYFDDLSALITSEGVTDVLFLYNVTTFAEDTSLGSMIDAIAGSA